jgi:F0F1-type ATP synthase gamma subunit
MIEVKRITQELVELMSLKELVEAYAELASIRMKKTRDSVLFARKYLTQLGEIFEEVRYSYAREVRGYSRRRVFLGKKKKGVTFLPHNGKTVAVLVSANSRLYGELLRETFDLFLQEVRLGSEATIIGRVGLSMFKEVEKDRPVTYFDFPDEQVDSQMIGQIIKHLVPYESINLYFGKYYNEGAPKPTTLNMSSDIKMDETGKQKVVQYLFEPTLEDVLKFFERQIFANIFEQAIRESQLAKYASRLIAMNKAEVGVIDRLDLTKRRKLQLQHRLVNSKQLNLQVSLFGRMD